MSVSPITGRDRSEPRLSQQVTGGSRVRQHSGMRVYTVVGVNHLTGKVLLGHPDLAAPKPVDAWTLDLDYVLLAETDGEPTGGVA